MSVPSPAPGELVRLSDGAEGVITQVFADEYGTPACVIVKVWENRWHALPTEQLRPRGWDA